ncbi:MAG: sugar phosphate isomerase/epimerase [Elusimicrobia bacterium]|nr:sugar phosphate isomerase/epimerase [Elusimicrobiota bacterium]
MIAFSTLMAERAGGYRKILPLRKDGLKNLELTWAAGVDIDDRKSFLKVSAELKKAGIELTSAHAPLHTANGRDVDVSSLDNWMRKFAVRETQKSILALFLMAGAGKKTVIHIGRAVENENRKEHIKMAALSLKEICEFASEFNAEICLENTLPGHLGCFLDELLEAREKSGCGEIKFCLDTGHYNFGEEQDDLLSEMAPDITELHIHDNDGKKDSHLVPGRGTIDWEALFELTGLKERLNVFEIMQGGAAEIKQCLKFAADYGIQ